MRPLLLLFLISVYILSCKKKVEKVPTTDKREITVDTIYTQKKNLSDFHIFDLYSMENDGKYSSFISLSDIYNDSLAVPEDIIQNQKTRTFAELKHFELTGNYREKLLKGTSLSEIDTLFLYDYKNARLQKFPIRDLKSVANLNLYTSEGEEISDYDYMIGFELNQTESSQEKAMDKTNYSLAYFGKKNPFSGEKMVPIHWKKTTAEEYPLSLKNQKNLGDTYTAKFENFTYYLQDFTGEYGNSKRQLAVLKDRKIIYAKTFSLGEGADFSPLNFVNNDDYNDWQWTGRLFKDKPPVVFGFVSESFGCSSINFLDQSYPDFYIDCDNRH